MKYDKQKYSGHKYIDAEKQEIGLAETTININLRTLKAIFNFLYREDLIEVNPIENVKLLRQDNVNDLTNALTDEEIKEIMSQPDRRDFVGFRDWVAMNTLLDTGLRINELLSLRAEDVDIKTRFIMVRSERVKKLGFIASRSRKTAIILCIFVNGVYI